MFTSIPLPKTRSTRDKILLMVAEGLAKTRMSFPEFVHKYLLHHTPLAPSEFHRALSERLEYITDHRGQSDVWMAPRGNAKSTLISLAYILYCVCTEMEKYIVLVSDTHSQSVQFLEDVKIELETNELLKSAFPAATGKGAKWSEGEIITRNNIMVTAMGMRGKIRGRKFGAYRPTLIIIDDPENDESAISPRQRERTRNWLAKGAVAAGIPGHTNIVIIGTVINADCLVKVLADADHGLGGWRSFLWQSIIEWPTRMDLWDEWTRLYHDDMIAEVEDQEDARPDTAGAFYKKHKADMHLGSIVLWPEREDLYQLMCYRAQIGKVAFESEKQNRAINPDQCLFQEDWFDDVLFVDEPWLDNRTGWLCFGGCDPSVGKDAKGGDYCAILTVYWKPGTKHLYIYTDMKRRPNGEIATRVFELNRIHKYDQFVFEDNGFQSVLSDAMKTAAMDAKIRLPIVTITHTKPKHNRIQRLGVYFEHGYFKFKKGCQDSRALIKQAKMYPIGDHDDGPDCLEMILWTISEYMDERRRRGLS